MEEIGKMHKWYFVPFTDVAFPLGGINVMTVANTMGVVFVLLTLLWLAARKFQQVPGRAQVAVEMLVEGFDSLVTASIGLSKEVNRHFLPLIVSLLTFIFLCNSFLILPIPYVEKPTMDLNCTLSLGLMVVLYSMYNGVRFHGIKGYLAHLAGPMWHTEGKFQLSHLPAKLSALFFFPLSIVENISRIISISFRLFGNITGGAVVITVVTALTYSLVSPLPMFAFFLLFEAAIQAFVFSLLSLMYIASAVGEE
jgi:F-type H+-transporting ATPase subunit a